MVSPDEIKNDEVESKAIFNISGVDDYLSEEKGQKNMVSFGNELIKEIDNFRKLRVGAGVNI
jgi:hypothetical protein